MVVDDVSIICEAFFKAIIIDNEELLKRITTNDFVLDSHLVGKVFGNGNLSNQLKPVYGSKKMLKHNLENVVVYANENTARVSLHSLSFLGGNRNNYFHYCQFGETYVFNLRSFDGSWQIVDGKSDLCWITGNTSWLKKYNLIDYSKTRNQFQIINSSTDAPHLIIENENKDDLNLIKRTVFEYGWVLDTEDIALLRRIMKEECVINDGYHNRVIHGRKNWEEYITELNSKEPAMHHSYRVSSIDISDNKAICVMYRLEPNRIGSKVIGEHNWWSDWYTLEYVINLEKNDIAWVINEVTFNKNIFFEMTKSLINKPSKIDDIL